MSGDTILRSQGAKASAREGRISNQAVPKRQGSSLVLTERWSLPSSRRSRLRRNRASGSGMIGAVVGDADALAVLLDPGSQKIVCLRQRDSHAGWQLRSVRGARSPSRGGTGARFWSCNARRARRRCPPLTAAAIPPHRRRNRPRPSAHPTHHSRARSTPKNGEYIDFGIFAPKN